MGKITAINFILPVIEALSPHEVFETGANKPLLITGVDYKGTKGDYVVKFRAAERLSNEAFMRELLAAFIAAEMEIKVVSPVIVNVSQNFVDMLVGNSTWQYASKSLGFNYGSEYIKGYLTIPISQDLNNHQLVYAQTIFAFDILIQNSDRTTNKPNMITNGNEIVIFDHELAFGFVFDLFENPNPWKIREVDHEWINRHCFLSKIKGKFFDFDEFSNRFNNLDEQFWNKAWNSVPDEWKNQQFEKIEKHISSIRAHKDDFILELKKLMA